MNELIYSNTNNITVDACEIIDSAQTAAYRAVNTTLTIRNWLLGKRISEEILRESDRAEYGKEVIKELSNTLTKKYGKGFNLRTLYKCQQFYRYFPEIVRSLAAQSDGVLIVRPMTAQLLSWSHYEKLLQVTDEVARNWYAKEAYEQTWNVRTLQRNISSQY